MNNDLVSLSVELAKAHLIQNRMTPQQVPEFVRDIHKVLVELQNTGTPPASRATTADRHLALGATAQRDAQSTEGSPEAQEGEVVSQSAGAPPTAARVAAILHDDISDPAFAGLDPWLAKRINQKMAGKLDPTNAIHPTVFPEYLVCLEDGEKVKLLRPYVQKRFGLAFNDYIDKWNLPDDYPTAPPKYLEAKRAAAKASGLGVTTRAKREKATAAKSPQGARGRGRPPKAPKVDTRASSRPAAAGRRRQK